MPITLAQDPLPSQFTLPAETIASIIAVLEWRARQPDWFDLYDEQEAFLSFWLREHIGNTPEWAALTEEQQEWLWNFELEGGGLVVTTSKVDDQSFPVVSA